MLVKEAKEIARQWVMEEARRTNDFYGAYFAGSTNWMPDDTPMPPTSDIDVKLVVGDRKQYPMFVKTSVNGVIVDYSYADFDAFQSPVTTLVTYYAARHFTTPNVILDPTGQLTKVQEVVARDFAKRTWVYKRAENAYEWLQTSLNLSNSRTVWPDQLFFSLYPLAIIHHVILVADLKNPTVGGAFLNGKTTLTDYGYHQFHEEVLQLLGCATLSQAQVTAHMGALIELFDVAKTMVQTPFFGSTTIAEAARAIVIDRNQQHIREGHHRETMFWLVSYVSWCQFVLYNDASKDVQQRFAPMYQELLADLGVYNVGDIARRKEELRTFLPRIWEVAEDIMARNPEIHD